MFANTRCSFNHARQPSSSVSKYSTVNLRSTFSLSTVEIKENSFERMLHYVITTRFVGSSLYFQISDKRRKSRTDIHTKQ